MSQTVNPKPVLPISGKPHFLALPPPSRTPHGNKTCSTKGQPDLNVERTKKKKEPKFVPYEPYKAATKPIIALQNAQRKKKKPSVEGCSKKTSLSQEPQTNKENLSVLPTEKKRGVMAVTPIILSKLSEKKESKGHEADSGDHCCDFASMQQEMNKLREEKESLTAQLQVQVKINRDLKKLLVASVGEDLEARMQFLTEDKVKLAYDVNHYVEQLIADNEELEKLSIQCDVWRSKFLASSLIVDELANWKAVLYHRYDDALEALRVLLDEQTALKDRLQSANSCLLSVSNAFNPTSQHPTRHKVPTNVLELSSSIQQKSTALHISLLGSTPINFSEKLEVEEPTTGEQRARQVLAGPGLYHPPLDRLALMNIGTNAQSLRSGVVHRFHPNVRYEYLTMNCCGHCRGDIKLL